MRRLLPGIFIALVLGCSGEQTDRSVAEPIDRLRSDGNDARFARALAPRDFHFPADHGDHPRFRSEWWYVTGNLEDPAGRRFGYQFTLFRFALPAERETNAKWSADQLWVAQFAVSDPSAEQFHAGGRSARQAHGLAGARIDESGAQVWVEDVSITSGEDETPWTIEAIETDFALQLELHPVTPIVLNGESGLSQKSAAPGNASYYYAIPRMETRGTLQVGETTFRVSGQSWLDREWSTSSLADDQQGWDWFALQLEDGRNLMIYRLRGPNGETGPYSSLTWSDASGLISTGPVSVGMMREIRYWSSPATGARYPVDWQINLPTGRLMIDAVMDDQEHTGQLRYWEGAVDVTGTLDEKAVRGQGYLEMTGYGNARN